ncbi:unnamed protein product [Urochloa humidicola]
MALGHGTDKVWVYPFVAPHPLPCQLPSRAGPWSSGQITAVGLKILSGKGLSQNCWGTFALMVLFFC